MRLCISIAALAFIGTTANAGIPGVFLEQAPWLSKLPFPKGMTTYRQERYTQSIYVLGNRDVIEKVPISGIDPKWHVSGGMEGVKGVKSDKFRLVPGKIETWTALIQVDNSMGFKQDNRALLRSYPDGTRFDDVLSYKGVVFEHRSRQKQSGKWKSEVLYEDKAARPKGYTGLVSTCGACHNKSASGSYDKGLVPGGDTIISDPMNWRAAGNLLRIR